MKTIFGCVIVTTLSISLFGCPQPTRPDDELTLTGKDWRLVGSWTGTIKVPNVGSNQISVAFTETEFEWAESAESGPSVWRGLYAVDTASDVYKIDFVPTSTNPYVRDAEGYLLVGVYEVSTFMGRQDLRFTFVKAASHSRPLSVDTGGGIVDVRRSTTKSDEEPAMSLMELGLGL